MSSSGRSSFAAEGDEGFSSQDNTDRREGSGADEDEKKYYANPREEHKAARSRVCRGYDELRGRPQDRYWPFVTIKKRYEVVFFYIVIYLYNMQRVPIIHIRIKLHSLFALRTAGHREKDNVEGFYRPFVYPQKNIFIQQPFRVYS